MAYEVLLKRSAEKELDALPASPRQRVLDKIVHLAEDPRPRGVKKLSARDEYRIRVGQYRVLYTIQDSEKTVRIMAVGHRGSIYR